MSNEAQSLAVEAVDMFERGNITLLSSVPVDGANIETPLKVADVSIRALSPVELYLAIAPSQAKFHWSQGDPANEHSVMLEIRAIGNGSDFHSGEGIDLPLRRTALALEPSNLRLSTRSPATFTVEPAWLTPVRRGRTAPFPKNTDAQVRVTPVALAEALDLRPKIPAQAFGEPTSGLAAACYRFAVISSRTSDLDRLLDSVALLESIVVPSNSQGELPYQVVMHGAWLLEPHNAVSRALLYRRLKRAYADRSKIAHGKGPGSLQDLHESAVFSYESARLALRHVVAAGWPEDQHFVNLLLRGQVPTVD